MPYEILVFKQLTSSSNYEDNNVNLVIHGNAMVSVC